MTLHEYDERHGGPFDRGAADSWYRRPFEPHYYTDGTGQSPRVELKDMTTSEIEAYTAGFEYNEKMGGHKEY